MCPIDLETFCLYMIFSTIFLSRDISDLCSKTLVNMQEIAKKMFWFTNTNDIKNEQKRPHIPHWNLKLDFDLK